MHHYYTDITITSTNPNFVPMPNLLPAATTESTVSVTFAGTANDNGLIIVSSGTLSDTVTVIGEIYVPPIDTIIYTTGFEAGEAFDIQLSGTTPYYQNDDPFYTGGANEEWGFIHGTPTNTAAAIITGSQSAQMRYYVSGAHDGHIGCAFTNFDLHNVTKITFKAKKNVAALQLKAQYSTDGGYSWAGDSTFVLNTNPSDFTYFVTDSGQYYNVRLKFSIDFNGTPVAAQLTIDEVKVYGVLGLEPTIMDTADMPMFEKDGLPDFTYIDGDTIYGACGCPDVIILSPYPDANIYYTIDESEPTTASSLYAGEVISWGVPVLKAITVRPDMVNSPVATVYLICTGNINSAAQDLITLYPNPTQSFIKLDNLLEIQAQAIILYNAQGQLVGKYAVTNNNAEISLSGMAAGTYFVQIVTPKGNIVKKLSKL